MAITHGIPDLFGAGGVGLSPDGEVVLRDVLRSMRGANGSPVANAAALDALGPNYRSDGQIRLNLATQQRWIYVDAATAVDASGLFFRKPTDNPATGGWCLIPGEVDIAMPVGAATLDAAVLSMLPVNSLFMPFEFFYEIPTTGFTGGASSAIGLSSNKANYNTKGDLLGGATGDVAATLVAGTPNLGTIGTKWATLANKRMIMKAGDTFRYDRITSAFTAGAGRIHAVGHLIANPGL